MALAHEMILIGAALGVLSVFAGMLSRRVGAPVLLVFLVLGMLTGEDGPGHIRYDDFASAYLVGSVAARGDPVPGRSSDTPLDAAPRLSGRR